MLDGYNNENNIMPIYDYKCRECGISFDIVSSFDAPPLEKCPWCDGDLRKVYSAQPDLPNMLLAEPFKSAIQARQAAWRAVIQTAVGSGIPVPGLAASLAYFDAYRTGRLPANLTQAQRDFFGSHTYRRIDKDGVFHTEWED